MKIKCSIKVLLTLAEINLWSTHNIPCRFIFRERWIRVINGAEEPCDLQVNVFYHIKWQWANRCSMAIILYSWVCAAIAGRHSPTALFRQWLIACVNQSQHTKAARSKAWIFNTIYIYATGLSLCVALSSSVPPFLPEGVRVCAWRMSDTAVRIVNLQTIIPTLCAPHAEALLMDNLIPEHTHIYLGGPRGKENPSHGHLKETARRDSECIQAYMRTQVVSVCPA